MSIVPLRMRVDRIRPESTRAKCFRLRPEEGPLPFSFLAGQHLGVRPPAREGDASAGASPWRHFSLCSRPTETRFVEIAVLRQSPYTEALHALREGDLVEVTHPEGRFVLEPGALPDPVFYAAGIGIAPIRSMLLTCLDDPAAESVLLFGRFASPEEGIFVDELRRRAMEDPSLTCRISFSRTGNGTVAPSRRPDWTDELFRRWIEHPCERTHHLCLPPGLREKTEAALAAMDVPPDRIRKEIW